MGSSDTQDVVAAVVERAVVGAAVVPLVVVIVKFAVAVEVVAAAT